jgi:L-threonylcarbamoyladenylate synthase
MGLPTSAWRHSPPNADIKRAARIVRAGGIVVHATEHCFGFACDPLNPTAVQRLLRIKRRSAKKGLILLGGDVDQIADYVRQIPEHAAATWPGPHTWLLEPVAGVPHWITGKHPRLAVRVTAHPQAAALCRAAGTPIVSTSANRAGMKPTLTYRDALHRFGDIVDYVLAGRVGDLPNPTPIRDGLTGAVIRPG